MRNLLHEIGLDTWPALHRDPVFWLLVGAGMAVAAALRTLGLTGPLAEPIPWATLLLSMVLYQPLLEELLFRGVIQGQLLRASWARRSWLGVSLANLSTSLAFTAAHLLYLPSPWTLSILAPSLVFGYARERHGSVYPALLLHAAYNLSLLLARAW